MRFRRRASRRVLVIALAAVIGADVTFGAGCDPLLLPGSASDAAMKRADSAGAVDSCATSCVQDCFCCSQSETAGPALILPDLAALEPAPSPSCAFALSVFRPVPEPPPPSLS